MRSAMWWSRTEASGASLGDLGGARFVKAIRSEFRGGVEPVLVLLRRITQAKSSENPNKDPARSLVS